MSSLKPPPLDDDLGSQSDHLFMLTPFATSSRNNRPINEASTLFIKPGEVSRSMVDSRMSPDLLRDTG
jgi:hypothetical protein